MNKTSDKSSSWKRGRPRTIGKPLEGITTKLTLGRAWPWVKTRALLCDSGYNNITRSGES